MDHAATLSKIICAVHLNYREIFLGHNFGARVNVDIDSDSSGYWDQ